MTPREKAIELLNKYDEHCWISPIDQSITSYHRKKCVLICINEIIDALGNVENEPYPKDEIKYWEDVKEELNILS